MNHDEFLIDSVIPSWIETFPCSILFHSIFRWFVCEIHQHPQRPTPLARRPYRSGGLRFRQLRIRPAACHGCHGHRAKAGASPEVLVNPLVNIEKKRWKEFLTIFLYG